MLRKSIDKDLKSFIGDEIQAIMRFSYLLDLDLNRFIVKEPKSVEEVDTKRTNAFVSYKTNLEDEIEKCLQVANNKFTDETVKNTQLFKAAKSFMALAVLHGGCKHTFYCLNQSKIDSNGTNDEVACERKRLQIILEHALDSLIILNEIQNLELSDMSYKSRTVSLLRTVLNQIHNKWMSSHPDGANKPLPLKEFYRDNYLSITNLQQESMEPEVTDNSSVSKQSQAFYKPGLFAAIGSFVGASVSAYTGYSLLTAIGFFGGYILGDKRLFALSQNNDLKTQVKVANKN